jgi:4-hydroxy-2-oxoheptanedioate aldolase
VKFGGWSLLAHPVIVEAMAKAGVDFVGLDLQHGWFGYGETAGAIQLLEALSVPTYVRLSFADLPIMPRVLDVGARGVIIAMVEDASNAERAVRASRYQPRGDRSYGGQRYGLSPEPADLAEVEPEVYAMIETSSAFHAVDLIARVQGLAGLFVGPGDLGLALRASKGTGDDDASERIVHFGSDKLSWRQALQRISGAAHAAGIKAGMFAADADEAAYWGAAGFDMISISTDITLLRASLGAVFSSARELAFERPVESDAINPERT